MSEWVLRSQYDSSGSAVRFDVRGDSPPLVLVHGTPWSSFNTRHIIPKLAEIRAAEWDHVSTFGELIELVHNKASNKTS
ncbi:MAG: alpha/beta fold hydrolase [Acidiferrobacterales bacterium]